MAKKVNKIRSFLSIGIFLIGLIICSYPLISGIVQRQYQKDAVATYKNAVETTENTNVNKDWEDARAYNDMLYQTEGLVIGTERAEILSDENYNALLNVSGTGIMGSIDIPKLNVNLPIYHGTSDDVLEIGVGHVQGTSLPVGGANTRSVLTGHRGLPNSKLFTRLDEMDEGDLFFIQVLDETLAYQVISIEVIEPSEVDKLTTAADKDWVTLVTCTPYGINSHRLIVTGERIEYTVAEYDAIEPEMMSFREIFFSCIPFIFIAIAIVNFIKPIVVKKKRKEADDNEIKRKED